MSYHYEDPYERRRANTPNRRHAQSIYYHLARIAKDLRAIKDDFEHDAKAQRLLEVAARALIEVVGYLATRAEHKGKASRLKEGAT